jgi:hypothetical protein
MSNDQDRDLLSNFICIYKPESRESRVRFLNGLVAETYTYEFKDVFLMDRDNFHDVLLRGNLVEKIVVLVFTCFIAVLMPLVFPIQRFRKWTRRRKLLAKIQALHD